LSLAAGINWFFRAVWIMSKDFAPAKSFSTPSRAVGAFFMISDEIMESPTMRALTSSGLRSAVMSAIVPPSECPKITTGSLIQFLINDSTSAL